MARSSRIPGFGSSVLRSAAAYFGLVFGVGFVLGSLRVPFLVPRIGARAAELCEMPLMLAAVFLSAGFVVRRNCHAIGPRGWLAVGALTVALLIAAELLLAVVIAGRGIGAALADRDPVSGTVFLGMLLITAAMPWLRHRRGAVRDGAGTGRG